MCAWPIVLTFRQLIDGKLGSLTDMVVLENY